MLYNKYSINIKIYINISIYINNIIIQNLNIVKDKSNNLIVFYTNLFIPVNV